MTITRDEIDDLRDWVESVTDHLPVADTAAWEGAACSSIAEIQQGQTTWAEEMFCMVLAYHEGMVDFFDADPDRVHIITPGDSAMIAIASMLIEAGPQ
jgi:hypothetical protein